MAETKRCLGCTHDLQLTMFYSGRNHCKKCVIINSKKYYRDTYAPIVKKRYNDNKAYLYKNIDEDMIINIIKEKQLFNNILEKMQQHFIELNKEDTFTEYLINLGYIPL